jgi:hypothetical protein
MMPGDSTEAKAALTSRSLNAVGLATSGPRPETGDKSAARDRNWAAPSRRDAWKVRSCKSMCRTREVRNGT